MSKCNYLFHSANFQNLHQSIKIINRDINVISEECKDKQKLSLLAVHLVAFDKINEKKHEEGIDIINKKILQMNEKTNPVLRLSINLVMAVLLRFV